VLTRTWTISDGCGNSSTATSVISVFDNEAPQIIGVPVSLTIDCTDDIPPADVFAIDNCDPDVQLSLNATTETIGCTTYFIRRWNAVDACDNLTSAVQTIIISDLQDPILSEYPADLTLPCGELAPTAPDITVTDNCDADVQVVFTETTSGNPDCPNLTRTWCATDCTGNEVCHTQNINFIPVPGASTMDQLSAWQASPSEIIIKTLTVEQSKWNLEVYDVTGRMVQTIYSGDMNAQDQRQFVLDISHFNDAMYIIKFNNGETLITKNVVIIR